jgi:hypothetical protein
MGNFLAISSIIGRTKNDVITSLTNYANSVHGGLQPESNIDSETNNCCIMMRRMETSVFSIQTAL